MKADAAKMDRKLWKVLEATIGSLIQEGRDSKYVLNVLVDMLYGMSFQQMVVRLPIKEGGMGMRSLEQKILAAFVGSVEQSWVVCALSSVLSLVEMTASPGRPQLTPGGGSC